MKSQSPPIALPLKEEPAADSKSRYSENFYRFFFAIERLAGPGAVPWMMAPYVAWSVFKRRTEFPLFVRLRKSLPAALWRSLGPRRHYFRMIHVWHEFLGVAVSYHRLGEPSWQERMQVRGTPPQDLPEWGARPVILAFLHTGSFGLLRFWMRSRGVPTASLIEAMPEIVDNVHFQKYLDAGDRRYGLEGVPHMFRGPGALRAAIRFLRPGHVLTMALDGAKRASESDRLPAGALSISVKKGACRIAAQTGAVVVPVSVRRMSPCRYELRFGKPVPDELIRQEDFTAATQHLIAELWPDLENDPSDLNWTSLEAVAPLVQAGRTGWP